MGCGSVVLYQPGFDFSALHREIGKFLFLGQNHPSEGKRPSLLSKQFELPSPQNGPWLWSPPQGMEVLESTGLSDPDGAETPVGFQSAPSTGARPLDLVLRLAEARFCLFESERDAIEIAPCISDRLAQILWQIRPTKCAMAILGLLSIIFCPRERRPGEQVFQLEPCPAASVSMAKVERFLRRPERVRCFLWRVVCDPLRLQRRSDRLCFF